MVIDHYRTSRREARNNNCYCGVPKFKAGAPHCKRYCRILERQQYEASIREAETGCFTLVGDDSGVPF